MTKSETIYSIDEHLVNPGYIKVIEHYKQIDLSSKCLSIYAYIFIYLWYNKLMTHLFMKQEHTIKM